MAQPNEVTPNSIQRLETEAGKVGQGGGIVIGWSDGKELRYSAVQLRSACPCATCREKHGKPAQPEIQPQKSLPVIGLAEARPLEIESMQPVGQYAYNIAFSDGHNSGIYTFDLLYELGETRT